MILNTHTHTLIHCITHKSAKFCKKNFIDAGVKQLLSGKLFNYHGPFIPRRRWWFVFGFLFCQRQSDRRLTELLGDLEQSTQLDVGSVGQLVQKLLLLGCQHLSSLDDANVRISTESLYTCSWSLCSWHNSTWRPNGNGSNSSPCDHFSLRLVPCTTVHGFILYCIVL